MNIRGYLTCVAAGVSLLTFSAPAHAQDYYIGQIMAVGFNFCPRNMMEANGQLLPIRDYTPLFSLFGTTFGGDGMSNFALPDLRGRGMIGWGQGPGLQQYTPGQAGGAETVTLTAAQMPAHNHGGRVRATSQAANTDNPANAALADPPANDPVYRAADANTDLRAGTIQTDNAGGGQPVAILDPYLAVRYCVVVMGIYPSRP